MTNQKLALHETLEVLELLNLKNISLTKLSMMSPLVQEVKLKEIMNKEREMGSTSVNRLRHFLQEE